jgi:aerobic carbon-monoxide dehydrogenase medium subunit
MKPPAFDYVRPRSLDEAVEVLARHGGDAKILAGGQSLVPLLNFRMLRPAVLIDINRVPGLDAVTEAADGSVRVGALTRHFTLETSRPLARRLPIVPCAMTHVAHLAIRNRGTIGGSLSHADPAAELPMLALLLDAEIAIRRVGGARVLAARDFLVGMLTTALQDDEIVTEINFPPLPLAAGWAFEEFAQRSGDFAICAVGAIIDVRDGRVAEARIALMGVDETPVRATAAEQILVGRRPDPPLIKAAAASARAAVNPASDLRASADYRRHLVEALGEDVLAAACRRAEASPL